MPFNHVKVAGCYRGGGLLTRLIYARFQELVQSGHMHALPTLLPGQWHAGLKAVKSILRRIFIKRDRAWKAYTKVSSQDMSTTCDWHCKSMSLHTVHSPVSVDLTGHANNLHVCNGRLYDIIEI